MVQSWGVIRPVNRDQVLLLSIVLPAIVIALLWYGTQLVQSPYAG